MADFDARIAGELENNEFFLGIVEQLKLAASAEVTVRDSEPCPKGCGCQHVRMVRVPDYKLKLQIVEFLANRGVGRPAAVVEAGDEDRIVFERVVYLTEEAA